MSLVYLNFGESLHDQRFGEVLKLSSILSALSRGDHLAVLFAESRVLFGYMAPDSHHATKLLEAVRALLFAALQRQFLSYRIFLSLGLYWHEAFALGDLLFWLQNFTQLGHGFTLSQILGALVALGVSRHGDLTFGYARYRVKIWPIMINFSIIRVWLPSFLGYIGALSLDFVSLLEWTHDSVLILL